MSNYVPHEVQRIKGWEAEKMAEPLKKFCNWLKSKKGKTHLEKVAKEIKTGLTPPQKG